ncbi:hypothetical protein CISG_01502 [Coccidioides immitis RMSCC 3703]|uniref:Hemerythrin-like domain-containing protein n=1 Tax=Coccidioides immitis RMSCC 3703 TaxID=454286 RepID=A0A0J8TV73_COCIT|nr:hypothetical protein CISG_01502 [Coccidioides immitis RMSCC 3703]
MSNPWADTPLSLISETGIKSRPDIPLDHAAVEGAQKMAAIHNILLRSFNASYNQCLGVKRNTKEASDFLVFNQVLYEMTSHHHHLEETCLFPEIEKFTGVKGLMDKNIREHKDFEGGLEKLREFSFSTDASTYDGEALKAILDILGPVLEKHFHGEISTFLDLAEYDSKAMAKAWDLVAKKGASSTIKSRTGVMILVCSDNTFAIDEKEGGYPPFPAFVPYLTKWVFQWRHAGTWHFAPSDVFGNPKPLAFLNPKTT